MKRKRIIKIKSPQLRNIRNNLRKLLLEATRQRVKYLSKLIDEEIKHSPELSDHWKEMQSLADLHSICECAYPFCRANDKDMVYDPETQRWYCIDCYEEILSFRDPKYKFNKGVVVRDNIEKPCYNLGWCPFGALVECFYSHRERPTILCKVYGHDCPAFYLSENINEKSSTYSFRNEKLQDNIKNWPNFNDKKIIATDVEKPCHILFWCPYGTMGDEFKPNKSMNRYDCNIFPHKCPVFYHAEPFSEEGS
ncbi:MAG: hypothetical protein ACFFA3_17330 [Promethearchaeota archaeon]